MWGEESLIREIEIRKEYSPSWGLGIEDRRLKN